MLNADAGEFAIQGFRKPGKLVLIGTDLCPIDCTFDSDPVHEAQNRGETTLRIEEHVGVYNSIS